MNPLGRSPVHFYQLSLGKVRVHDDRLKVAEDRSPPEVLKKPLHQAAVRPGIVDGNHQRRDLAQIVHV